MRPAVLLLALVASLLWFVAGCGDDEPAVVECIVPVNEPTVCILYPPCPSDLWRSAYCGVDDEISGLPVHFCDHKDGRPYDNCVILYPDGAPAGLCEARDVACPAVSP